MTEIIGRVGWRNLPPVIPVNTSGLVMYIDASISDNYQMLRYYKTLMQPKHVLDYKKIKIKLWQK